MRVASWSMFCSFSSMVAFLAFTACSRTGDSGASGTAAPSEGSASPSTTAAPKTLTDAAIRQAVVDELFRSPHARDGAIIVACTDGVVELTGTVNNLLAKDRAVAITESVRGVRAVSDRIRVAPVARSDSELVKAVETALLYDPAADAYKVNVSSTEGLVRLTGSVDSWEERRLSERLARGVRGVRAVQNDITVNVFRNRSDAEVQRDVQSRLHWDTFVKDGLIDVKVADGNVRLSGTVGSAAEKSQAYYDAWVRGARHVDASELKVDAWARDDRLRGQKYAHKSDPEIAAAVKDALVYDPRIDSSNVYTRADGGVLTLSGRVRSVKERLAAESVALHTVGVRGVHNELDVQPGKAVTDTELTARLKASLAASPVLDGSGIDAAVSHGEATLSGRVPTLFDSAEAVDIANSLEGVTKVTNRLTVTSPEIAYVWVEHVFPFGPYVDKGSFVGTEPAQQDKDILANIERELERSPFVDADQVHVEVHQGKATLKGTVDSWRERATATENAYEGGAIAVDNQLKVG